MKLSADTDRPGRGPGARHAAGPEGEAGAGGVRSPERVRLTRGGAAALAMLVVVAGVLAMFIRQAQSPATAPSVAAPATSPEAPASSPAPTGPVVLAPSPATTSAPPAPPPAPSVPPGKAAPDLPAAATFEMAASSRSVTVRSEDLGADRYRVTLAKAEGPVTAKVSDSGTSHRLTLVKDPGTRAPAVTITLNSAIRWSLKMTAGNTKTSADLTASRLASLELAGGAHAFALALPAATGTLPLRVTHGMNQLTINTNGVPVRLSLRVGAGKAILDGVTHIDTRPGKVLTSDSFATATDRVDVDSIEGVGTLTVDTD